MPSKPTLCLDFDGVIHSYISGWRGACNIPDPPVQGALMFMWDALESWNVVVHSSRARHIFGPRAMRAWLYRHASEYQLWYEEMGHPGLEDVKFVRFKPAALVTIDDRALTFDGRWPPLGDLRAFKPWHARPLKPNIIIAQRPARMPPKADWGI